MKWTLMLLGSTLLACTAIQAQPENELQQEASALTQQFIAQLKPELKNAIQTKGPVHAIEVCASVAPRIADALSFESGWQVSRVSLKQRNVSRAMPDEWERGVLQQFDKLQAEGTEAGHLNRGEIVGEQYRFMQAQLTEPVCLVCHGETRSEEIREILDQYYPDDSAIGYSLGQVRGAISVIKDLHP